MNKPGAANKHNSIIEIENFSGTVTDWVVSGFEVANSPKYGIDVRVTDRITIQNNHVHNSALTGIFTAFSNHVLIQNNESDHNDEHGIYQSNSSIYPTIRGNRSHHNASAGIHMNGDISEQPGNGLVQFATVENNIIWENGRAAVPESTATAWMTAFFETTCCTTTTPAGFRFTPSTARTVRATTGQQHHRDGGEFALRDQHSE